MSPKLQTPSAIESAWAKHVDASLCYMVVNVDAMMDSMFMKSVNRIIVNNIIEEYQPIYTNAVNTISYIYTSAKSLNCAEFVIVFDDDTTNSLEQINAIVLPTLVNEAIKTTL